MRKEGYSCPDCNGSGTISFSKHLVSGWVERYETCPTCDGRGQLVPCYEDSEIALFEMVNEPVEVNRKSFLERLFGL